MKTARKPIKLPEQEVRNRLISLMEKIHQSFLKGMCSKCGLKVENWPVDVMNSKKWKVPSGWKYAESFDGETRCITCPQCMRKDSPL